MCISPITIKNPNYKHNKNGLFKYKDCTSPYIKVSCGKCPDCIAHKQFDLVQRVLCESLSNYLFFATLTYNQESLPIQVIDGNEIAYADMKDVQDMFKRVRKIFSRPFRYIVVSEFGSKKGRPHFHILFSVPKYEIDKESQFPHVKLEMELYNVIKSQWSTNKGTRKNPIYSPNCTYATGWKNGRMIYNFDLHFVEPRFSKDGVSDVAYYVIKYMMKQSKHEKELQETLQLALDEEEYKKIWNKVKTHRTISKGFGLMTQGTEFNSKKTTIKDDFIDEKVREHIRKGIEFGKAYYPYPVFIHPDTGKTYPLNNFYKHYFYKPEDAAIYYQNQEHYGTDDSFHVDEIVSLNTKLNKINNYNKRCRQLEDKAYY